MDSFINKNEHIKQLTKDFIDHIADKDNDIYLTDNCATYLYIADTARMLWLQAVTQFKNHNYDDRPLYWARLKMQAWLKRHPAFILGRDYESNSQVKKGSKLDTVITLFEEKSRNYTGIDFGRAGGKKKILITGFDPFMLDKSYVPSGFGPGTFNPSGIVALRLHSYYNEKFFIQTCIFPVRYEDFDNECVEKVIRKHFDEVDIIMTTSLNGSNDWFDVEQNAIAYRGGLGDNMYIGKNENKNRFIENNSSIHNLTTLPQNKIFGNNQTFSIKINNLDVNYDTSNLDDTTEGAGGNYLSNEIMYRATSVRDTIQANLSLEKRKPVGHFHLAKKGIEDTNILINVVIEVVKKILS